MAEPHVVTGLIAKRAEIAGQIEHTQDSLRQLVIDLDYIDAAIHIFDPSSPAGGLAAATGTHGGTKRSGDAEGTPQV